MSKAEQKVRTTLSETVQDWATKERIEKMLDEIEGLTKKTRIQCPNCNKISYVEVSDDVRKLEALLKVIEQTEGKPGTAEGEPGGITIIVERNWPVGPNTDSRQLQPTRPADHLPPEPSEG